MKRSAAIKLAMMGAGVTAVAALAFCDNDSVSAATYESVDQCAAGGLARDACERAFNEARAEHLRASPRYAKREDCEAEFGADGCLMMPQSAPNQTDTAATLFVPAMAGFLLANAAGSAFSAQPLYRACHESNDPRCRSSSGGSTGGYYGGGGSGGGSGGRWLYTASGERVSPGSGPVSVGRSVFTNHPSSLTLARGGFGARASLHAAS